jgi:hypothetical protein
MEANGDDEWRVEVAAHVMDFDGSATGTGLRWWSTTRLW